VVERSFGWLARFRRLARDYERLAQSLAGFHLIAFAILMAARLEVSEFRSRHYRRFNLPHLVADWGQ